MRLAPADSLELPSLHALFNEGYSEYVIPLRLSETAFSDHISEHDVDLRCSCVAVVDRPAALALIARRGGAGWVAGVGTAPAYRRRGLAECALVAGLEAAAERGCESVGLEVIDRNVGATALYRKLGFEVARELIVWSWQGGSGRAEAESVPCEEAMAWIAGARPSPEPWQRADSTIARMRARGVHLDGWTVRRAGEIVACAVVRAVPAGASVVQIAALDAEAARQVLRAAAAGRQTLRVSNVPAGEPASHALQGLGAELVARQYEMELRL